MKRWEDKNKAMCADVQRDPYGNVLSNYERLMAKQLPARMFFNAVAVGVASLYYLSRHNEINRVRRLVLSLDMMINVGARAVVAAIAADVVTRKLFVNYDRLTSHKVAVNEVKKIMR